MNKVDLTLQLKFKIGKIGNKGIFLLHE